jgi:hypothetical protein
MKRIEFDKKDPKGPEQLALKLMINSCYGKLAERKFRGDQGFFDRDLKFLAPRDCRKNIVAHIKPVPRSWVQNDAIMQTEWKRIKRRVHIEAKLDAKD